MDHNRIGWKRVDWIDLAADMEKWLAVVNALMNLWIKKCGEILDYLRKYKLLTLCYSL
jgi:hypothetical protein